MLFAWTGNKAHCSITAYLAVKWEGETFSLLTGYGQNSEDSNHKKVIKAL